MSSDPELDELLRELERLLAAREWDAVLQLRDRARAAFERGRQHWPAAAHAEYRLALEAPGEWAGAVVVEDAGRFALGPLAEVAASTHTWAELRDHVPHGPLRSVVAHERVVRGEDLSGDPTIDADVLPVPLLLQPFEPQPYPVATYRADKADFPAPPLPRLTAIDLPVGAPIVDRDIEALVAVARTWVTQSNGRAEVVAVEGRALDAIAALDVRRARAAEIDAGVALGVLAWTAASGGAEGRRRGMAWGRYAAHDAIASIVGSGSDELADVVDDLRFFVWDGGAPSSGWECRIAIEDTVDGISIALSATDTATLV